MKWRPIISLLMDRGLGLQVALLGSQQPQRVTDSVATAACRALTSLGGAVAAAPPSLLRCLCVLLANLLGDGQRRQLQVRRPLFDQQRLLFFRVERENDRQILQLLSRKRKASFQNRIFL